MDCGLSLSYIASDRAESCERLCFRKPFRFPHLLASRDIPLLRSGILSVLDIYKHFAATQLRRLASLLQFPGKCLTQFESDYSSSASKTQTAAKWRKPSRAFTAATMLRLTVPALVRQAR